MYRQSFPQPEGVGQRQVVDETPVTEPRIEPTALTPIDTTHETPDQHLNEPEPAPASTLESYPGQPSLSDATPISTLGSRSGFSTIPSDPALRPSSSSHLPDSYYTAPEFQGASRILSSSPITEEPFDLGGDGIDDRIENRPANISWEEAPPDEQASTTSAPSPSRGTQSGADVTSQTFLLPHGKTFNGESPSPRSSGHLRREEPSFVEHEETGSKSRRQRFLTRVTSGMVRFNIEDSIGDRQRRIQKRLSRTESEQNSATKRQRRASRWGEIVRAERMLVRIESTTQSIPREYNENDSIKIDTKIMSKWREFLVCSYEIPIVPNRTKVNLFSTLDKTLVVWQPYKLGTQIFIMRPRSSSHSVEWFTFLRGALGWKQPSTLFVHVPDLDISLHLENPFAHLGENRNEDDDVCTAVLRTMKEERAIASGIVKTCLTTLSECSEWNKILNMWAGKSMKMGLAWRRYDRLEWVQGPNEQRMYGTMAMRMTHELELRPKQHYPTSTKPRKSGPRLEEPSPAEGFLILLTSQRGRQKLLGKNFFKKLYFFTQDQYLCFCRPARANPPAPPRLSIIPGRHIPTSAEIRKEVPIVYNVDPFPIDDDGEIAWLSVGRKEFAKKHDAEAFAENRRIAKNAANAEGYINLCRVSEIRPVSSDSMQEEQHANAGDVEYHGERGRPANGARHETKDDRSFEIVLEDGLVVRFRSYNMQTRQEWIKQLTKLWEYWKMSGPLYRKPRRRGAFTKCSVLLIEGQLLIFQGALRGWTGEQLPHTHHFRQGILDLRDCYVYSGIITSEDLLYQHQTFDSNLPGQHERPRMYTGDGWTSSDEDTATCFVIWHATRKALFRAELGEKGKIKRRRWRQVSALGVPGKSIVFKARSRAERDLWVLAIATEIDRLQQREDLRIVEPS
ncbi:predicted protein [Uncinocarpus reesii 1704]|uniref:PH domain-containing protein n=1 Tax=Uncinocarpus reesii (strain UAMH 1704) TaxID=336963 RepID=C4JKW2_UNCRE|nr:uncharacterized protein UREG_00195 [Uncinocarpus reesii 1704]EEP75349.1 predicted protein [Uncinocarpus reesii 1704]